MLLALCATGAVAQQVDFRGPGHCGIYSGEKNLLKQWGFLPRIFT